jgi:hypothetical protein
MRHVRHTNTYILILQSANVTPMEFQVLFGLQRKSDSDKFHGTFTSQNFRSYRLKLFTLRHFKSRGLFFISECSISNIIPVSKKHVIDGVWMQNKTLPWWWHLWNVGTFYKTTRRNIPEDSGHLHTLNVLGASKNRKSPIIVFSQPFVCPSACNSAKTLINFD